MTPTLATLLIDARGAGPRLPRELARVASLAGDQPLEVVVIDDTNDRRVAGIARRYGAHHLPLSPARLGERLATAIPRTAGEVLVFPVLGCVDAAPTLLRLARRVGAGEIDAVSLTDARPRLIDRLLGRRRTEGEVGVCMTREWYERIGGCDARLDREALPDLLTRLRLCGARIAPAQAIEKA
ncbi:MAG: glycosyltransferase family A protein [Halomonas sp.]